MTEASIVVVLVTASGLDEARRIGRALVEERLAACVNVVGPITSIYRWEGRVQEEAEHLLLVKARRADCRRDVEMIVDHQAHAGVGRDRQDLSGQFPDFPGRRSLCPQLHEIGAACAQGPRDRHRVPSGEIGGVDERVEAAVAERPERGRGHGS